MRVPNLSRYRQSPALVALGGALRTRRLERGLSQEELALAAEVDPSYVGRVERGDSNVAMLTLLKLLNALELTLRDIGERAKL